MLMARDEKKIRDHVEKITDFDGVSVEFKDKGDGKNKKISIHGLKLRNPILDASMGQSIIANISKQISPEEIRDLDMLRKKGRKENFEEKFREIVMNKISFNLKKKLESDDLPTPIFPTSVAIKEIPNYYISQPKETYTLDIKLELFNKLAESICGKCGQSLYGLYVPEEGFKIKETLKNYVRDFYNIDIGSIAGIGRINLDEVGPFEYVFYLLDKVLQEMFKKDSMPDCYIELLVIKGVGRGKKFFSHYIIPNINEIFFKLYHGENKYTTRGVSKIKTLISSFLVENWNVDSQLKNNNSEIAHTYINRILYYIFCHRKMDMDSILFLEDLKIKLGDTTPIRYLDEVISWM